MATPSGPPANDYLNFQSWSWQKRPRHSRELREFSALCGDNPPTIVDGYGKWNVIDRPLRQGVTVPLGFNPGKVKVEIRFGVWDGKFHGTRSDDTTWGLGWDKRAVAAEYVEIAIDNLHWMAGGNFEAGPSPVIYVDSFASNNPAAHTNLMPRQYQGVGWVITDGIEWGTSLRHPNGSRVYQEATFTLLGYTALGAPAPKQQHRQAGGYFQTTTFRSTALAIAADNTSHAPEAILRGLANAILADPRNNPCRGSRISLARRSPTWAMPTGLEVWVPAHQI